MSIDIKNINPRAIWDYHPNNIKYPMDGYFSGAKYSKRMIIADDNSISNTQTKIINHRFSIENIRNVPKPSIDFRNECVYTSDLFEILDSYKDHIGNIIQTEVEGKYEYSAEFKHDEIPSGVGYIAMPDKPDYVIVNKETAVNIREEEKNEGIIPFDPKLIVLWLKTYELLMKLPENEIRKILNKYYTKSFGLFKKLFYFIHEITDEVGGIDATGESSVAIVYSNGSEDGNEGYILTTGRNFSKHSYDETKKAKLGLTKGSRKITETPSQAMIRELEEEIGLKMTLAEIGDPAGTLSTTFGKPPHSEHVTNHIYLIEVDRVPIPTDDNYMGETTGIYVIKKRDMDVINRVGKSKGGDFRIPFKFNNVTSIAFFGDKREPIINSIFNPGGAGWKKK